MIIKKNVSQHPVYTLASFEDIKQKTVHIHPGDKVNISGKIKHLNYSLHGQLNGAVLDNGDFIHLKPYGAEKISLELGQNLSVEGEVCKSLISHRVIEAESVNGISLRDKAA